jgi:predicted nucleotidyltransferase component of viral defense system
LSYRFESEDLPPVRLKLKLEINTREHFTVYGLKAHRFEVASRWFSGGADLRTYELDELLGTKLRALYQRRKGRDLFDLFDLALALKQERVSPARVVEAFSRYMAEDEATISRALFEQNLHSKKSDPVFTADMSPLLASGQAWSFDDAFELVLRELIGRLPGAPWQGR